MSDEARKVTREKLEREFLNATTAYDRWIAFQKLMDWAVTASELADELGRKNQNQLQHIQRLDKKGEY